MYKGIAVSLLALVTGACGLHDTPLLANFEPGGGYRYENLRQAEANGGNAEDLFVILAISGGGMRSAALGYGVMERMRDTAVVWNGRERSLLDEVDVIAGVSAGAFPAAYYAAFGDRLFEDFGERFLYKNISGTLSVRLMWPRWIFDPLYGRSDLAAKYYDRKIFRRHTYGDLLKSGRRPFLVIGGTEMATAGSFPFTQSKFDTICADLSGVSLGRAVAASSAYPILLTPIALRNRAGKCGRPDALLAVSEVDAIWLPAYARDDKRRSVYRDSESRPFIHLLDGGIADYVGLMTALRELDAPGNGWNLTAMLRDGGIRKLVIVVVDAWAERPPADGASAEPPGIVEAIETIAYRATDSSRDIDRILGDALGPSGYPDSPPHTYLIRVGFSAIEDQRRRDRYDNIPATLYLPKDDINALRAIGGEILEQAPDFRELLEELGG